MQATTDKSAEMQRRLETGKRIAGRTTGLLHLGSGLATEILDVVERMHGTIGRRPHPLGQAEQDRTSGITGIVYRGIRNCFEIVGNSLGALARQTTKLAGEDEAPGWLAVRAAINGVCGDSLEARGNPLAMPMCIVSERGDPDSKTQVLFLHGLCMSEHGWRRGDFEAFEAWCADEFGARTAHLRYNSGRRISENGRELAGLLESHVCERGIERLVLVSHSMGGLLTRSACHYADGLQWPERLTHVAMLGTPHEGAPLERIGNFANGILKVSPYSTPLAHIGDLRSAGIKDLRFANLIDEDWLGVDDDVSHARHKAELPLLPHARYLFIAATRSGQLADPVWHSRDDMLVPVSSALGLKPDGKSGLQHSCLHRLVLADTGHIALMGHSDTWRHVRDWLSH